MGVTAQWLKFLLNKFREQFQIREIREINDPRNISAIATVCMIHLFVLKVNGEVKGKVVERFQILQHVIIEFLVPALVSCLDQQRPGLVVLGQCVLERERERERDTERERDIGTSHFVLYREVVLSLEVKIIYRESLYRDLFRIVSFIQSVLSNVLG